MIQQYEYSAVALPTRAKPSTDDSPGGTTGRSSREQQVAALLNDYAADGWRVVALHPASPTDAGYALLERPATTRPENDGAPWDENDYLTLAEGLGGGLDLQDLASALGRTTGAVEGRAGKLLRLIGYQEPELEDLRTELAKGRDILDLARYVHEADRRPLWTRANDERLREAWEAQTPPISVLAAEFGVTRNALMSRYVRTRLAVSKADVEAHFAHPAP